MRKLLLGVTTAMLVAGSAIAADVPVAPPLYRSAAFPPPPLPVYNWTGCYLGASAGGIWARKQYTSGTGLTFDDVTFPGVGTDLGSHDANSFIGVIQGGCNYQAGPWVVGAQADFGWSNAIGSHPDTFFIGVTDRSTTRSVGSVTGRVGYALDRVLPYVKAGGAWQRDEYVSYLTGTAFAVATASETRSGWTVGAGVEYGITINLSGFIEYDYYDFGTRNVPFFFNGFSTGNINIRESTHVVKAGLNWRFGPPPIVAY